MVSCVETRWKAAPPEPKPANPATTDPPPVDTPTTTYKIWTATPPKGWPKVHTDDPLGRLGYLSPEGIISVLDDNSDPILAFIWDAPTRNKNTNTAADLRKGLSLLLLHDERPTVRVIPANPSLATNTGQWAPETLSISNLSAEAKHFLLEQDVFSMRDPRITFSVYEPFHSHQTFLTMIAGYSEVNDKEAIHQNILNTILTSDYISELIKIVTDSHPTYRHMRKEDALHAVVNTAQTTILDLRTMSGRRTPRVCLYMNIPTDDFNLWRIIRNHIRTLNFVGPNGELCKSTNLDNPCCGCGAVDHPRQICPFQDVQGWNGTNLSYQLASSITETSNSDGTCKQYEPTAHQPEHDQALPAGPYEAPTNTTPLAKPLNLSDE
ncbi:hypothetical protein BC835DRAFT_1418973 [Cytidiella melzeri]|nr:hypothetical protein BC835DRAFT_1418973 [Cytidiella melzeri]